jgi:sugar lactone lactonase YvrE
MFRSLLSVVLGSVCFYAFSQNNLQSYVGQAREAYKANDYKKFYDLIIEANKIHPYHQGILYQSGLAAALNNKPDEAVAFLTKAVNIKADFDLTSPDFSSLQNNPAFQKLKSQQPELQKTIITSDTAFIVKDRTAHIESIARGEIPNTFYLGSIHKRKIISVDAKRKIVDFTTPAQDGLASVFGVKVDQKKKILWACSSPMREMENYDTTATSSVFKYDLKNKKLLRKFSPSKKQEYVFGDLTLDAKGDVFIADSKNNIIFTVNEKSGRLDEYFSSDEFWNLQGITFSDDGSSMFIADYIKGIFKLDVKTKQLIFLKSSFDASLKSIDGLTFYKNSLIAIQNAILPMRVTRYFLNSSQDGLIDYKIIDRGHPAFNEPTIGCIDGSNFYYVANSLWSGYTDDQKQKPEAELQDVVILKTKL